VILYAGNGRSSTGLRWCIRAGYFVLPRGKNSAVGRTERSVSVKGETGVEFSVKNRRIRFEEEQLKSVGSLVPGSVMTRVCAQTVRSLVKHLSELPTLHMEKKRRS